MLKEIINTRITPEEFLINSFISVNPKLILEIGTGHGATTLKMAENTKAVIFTVDMNFELGEKWKNTIYRHRIKQIICDSKFLDLSSFPKFDAIFIDGDHNIDYVKSDTEKAFDSIEKNGIIIWDDLIVPDIYNYLNSLDKIIYFMRWKGNEPNIKAWWVNK